MHSTSRSASSVGAIEGGRPVSDGVLWPLGWPSTAGHHVIVGDCPDGQLSPPDAWRWVRSDSR